ncbi:MAG: hypothetical protein WC980_05500 [Candidatus Brocadiia bacterium]
MALLVLALCFAQDKSQYVPFTSFRDKYQITRFAQTGTNALCSYWL